jgi:hypothetical protein
VTAAYSHGKRLHMANSERSNGPAVLLRVGFEGLCSLCRTLL